MRTLTLITALFLGGWATPPATTLHIVKMVGYTFEPAEITVNPGDTVRFVQETAMPHNVQFKGMPEGVDLGATTMGPYLVATGDTYDIVIGEEFSAGEYDYVCTPHETLDMKGIIQVADLM